MEDSLTKPEESNEVADLCREDGTTESEVARSPSKAAYFEVVASTGSGTNASTVSKMAALEACALDTTRSETYRTDIGGCSLALEDARAKSTHTLSSLAMTYNMPASDSTLEKDVFNKRPIPSEPYEECGKYDCEPVSKKARIEGTPPRGSSPESNPQVIISSPSILQESWKYNKKPNKIGIGEDHQVSSLPAVGSEEYSSEGGEVLWDSKAAQQSASASQQKIHGFLSQSHELSIKSMLLEALHKANYDAGQAKSLYIQIYRKYQDRTGFNPPVELSFEQFEDLEGAFTGIREENFNLKDLIQARIDGCPGFLLPNYDFDAIAKSTGLSKDAVMIYYYNSGRLSRESTRRTQASSKVINILLKEQTEDNDYCTICDDGGKLIICDSCNKSYHLKCHSPPLLVIPTGNWVCGRCSEKVDYSPSEVEYIPPNESKEFRGLLSQPCWSEKPSRLSNGDAKFVDQHPVSSEGHDAEDLSEVGAISYSAMDEEFYSLQESRQTQMAQQTHELPRKLPPESTKVLSSAFAADGNDNEALPLIIDTAMEFERPSPKSVSNDETVAQLSSADSITHKSTGTSTKGGLVGDQPLHSSEPSSEPSTPIAQRQEALSPMIRQQAQLEGEDCTKPSSASFVSMSLQPRGGTMETEKAD